MQTFQRSHRTTDIMGEKLGNELRTFMENNEKKTQALIEQN